MSEGPVQVFDVRGESFVGVRMSRPKANIIDAEMIRGLAAVVGQAAGQAHLKALLLCAEGTHFSFGASVEEHLPDQCAEMLAGLHSLILQLVEFPVPVLVAIKGQCLGAGLEVAAAGHLLFASAGARLGQPEIKLGVFAPAASCLLPLRLGQMQAEDLLYSGRSLTAEEGQRIGLLAAVAEDPEAAAIEYFDTHLAPLSASSLRMAVRASRLRFAPEVRERLQQVETLYLQVLMATDDALEGLTAFIAKRPPEWKDH